MDLFRVSCPRRRHAARGLSFTQIESRTTTSLRLLLLLFASSKFLTQITAFHNCYTNSAEKSYDTIPVRDWMAVHPWVPIVACVLYMALIPVGQAYFATRPRWNWRITLAVWNLFLSLFSAVGVIRTLPALWHLYSFYSVEENFCMDPESHFGSGTTGLWVQLFCLSKFPYVYIQSCAHHPMRTVDPVWPH